MVLKAEAVSPMTECDCPHCQRAAQALPSIAARIPAIMTLLESAPTMEIRLGVLSSVVVNTLLQVFPEDPFFAMGELHRLVSNALSLARQQRPNGESTPTTDDVGHA